MIKACYDLTAAMIGDVGLAAMAHEAVVACSGPRADVTGVEGQRKLEGEQPGSG